MKINTQLFEKLPLSIQAVIRDLIVKVKPAKIILFGSRARGDHRENSDFDIAVQIPVGSEPLFTRFVVDLSTEAKTLFQVDLINYSTLDETYHKNIAKEGKLIYG